MAWRLLFRKTSTGSVKYSGRPGSWLPVIIGCRTSCQGTNKADFYSAYVPSAGSPLTFREREYTLPSLLSIRAKYHQTLRQTHPPRYSKHRWHHPDGYRHRRSRLPLTSEEREQTLRLLPPNLDVNIVIPVRQTHPPRYSKHRRHHPDVYRHRRSRLHRKRNGMAA